MTSAAMRPRDLALALLVNLFGAPLLAQLQWKTRH